MPHNKSRRRFQYDFFPSYFKIAETCWCSWLGKGCLARGAKYVKYSKAGLACQELPGKRRTIDNWHGKCFILQSRGSINSQSFRKTLIECPPHPRFLHFFFKSINQALPSLSSSCSPPLSSPSASPSTPIQSLFSISSKTKCFHQEKISTFPWKYLERPLRKFLKYILP